MDNRMSSAAKVGAFMLVVLGIVGFFILRIEDIRITRAKTARKIDVIFDTVAGLDKKSLVRVAGVRVGKVTDIELTPEGRARVRIQFEEDVELHKGATARVASLGLLGDKYIEIDPGRATQPMYGENEKVVLSGSEPPTIDDVTSQVSAIATDVKAITESLRHSLGGPGGEQRLDEIVENVRQVTAKMRLLLEVNEGHVNATAANLQKITDDLRVEIPRIAASIDRFANSAGGTVSENREDIRAIVENLRSLSASLKTTVGNVNDVSGQIRSGEGTVGKLIYNDEAYNKLNAALTSVESGVTELKNTLGRANRIQMDLGIKADYYAGLSNANDPYTNIGGAARSAVTMNLIPNPEHNRFYNIEFADDPKGTRKEKITELTTIDQYGNSTTTTTRQVKTERNFVVSAQAGWSTDDLRLRVGLFDSTGGAGVDYLMNDRVTLTGEAFDFGKKREDNPHLRLYGQYVFRKEKKNSPLMFLSTGVDDVFNDTAFTVGGGIRWRDEDLKYLLGSVPIK